jgi:hypothetical protein
MKGKIVIFDPLGPDFQVFHESGGAKTQIGGAKKAAGASGTGGKVTLEIFDPFGPGFRVVRKGVG